MPKKHENEELNKRSYKVELRASEANEDKGAYIEGLPIVYNSPTLIRDWCGEYKEVIARGALDDTDLSDVLLFINHDFDKIALARSRNGKGTMTFNLTDEGLHIKALLDTENNSEARALHSAIVRGDMSGMSFAFRVNKEEWSELETDTPTRTITGISIVHEVSVVNFPAYNDTNVSARSTEENGYSPLAEARKRETADRSEERKRKVELEKEKLRYLMGGTL